MASHYVEIAELRAWQPADKATRYNQDRPISSHCSLCGVPSAPRRYYDFESQAEWLLREAPNLGNFDRLNGSPRRSSRPPVSAALRSQEYPERCVCCESQQRATSGIPRHILEPLWEKLSAAQRKFLTDAFVISTCAVCASSDAALNETATTIRHTYMRVNNIKSERDYDASNGIERFREILLLIDEQLRRLAG